MNCHEFENLVVDLARGAIKDSAVGTRCWAHAANCPGCADRLLNQEKLTAGLEALTGRTAAMRAPERFEARLRTEFRAQFAQQERHLACRESKWEYPLLRWMSPNYWVGVGAAAILLLALAGFLAENYLNKLPVTAMAQNSAAPKGTDLHKLMESKNVSPPAGLEMPPTARGSVPNSISKPHPSRRRRNNPRNPLRPTFRSATHDELATNFYPLPYGSGLPLDEGWEIVRVNLPRSALATLGVPLSGEQASAATIKADLVLGEDGLARAIRFVE